MRFEFSQRAQFVETVFNLSSLCHRPILQLKRPSLKETYLRIHITCGDANISEYATFLKIGTTAVILSCLSQGALHTLDFELVDPVAAFRSVSKTLERTDLRLKRGGQLSALEIQESLLEEILREQHTIKKPEYLEWDEIIHLWQEILHHLRPLQ
jgi:proteasome accessory factor A